MKLKIRFAWPKGAHPKAKLALIAALAAFGLVFLTGISVFGYYYVKYQRIVDNRLKQPIFAKTAKIYAAPREVRPGQKLTVALLVSELRAAGYSTEDASKRSLMGTYSEGEQTIRVRPGPQSYHAQDGATIRIGSGGNTSTRVVQSISDDRGQPLASYALEPLLITGLSDDANRTKRRLVN